MRSFFRSIPFLYAVSLALKVHVSPVYRHSKVQQLSSLSNEETEGLLTKIAAAQEETKGLLTKIAAAQLKSDENMLRIEANLLRIEASLENLIGYNANRDEELEEVIQYNALEELEAHGWETTKVTIKYMYSEDGSRLAEWDGIYFASTENPAVPATIFFIEAEQLFTMDKYNKFCDKMELMRVFLPTLKTTSTSNDNHKKTKSNINRYIHNREYAIGAIIGSPRIEEEVRDRIAAQKNCSFITLQLDQYKMVLQGEAIIIRRSPCPFL